MVNLFGHTSRHHSAIVAISPTYDSISSEDYLTSFSLYIGKQKKELRVAIRIPRDECNKLIAENKKVVFSEVYNKMPVDWDIEYCGEMYHVKNWKYSE